MSRGRALAQRIYWAGLEQMPLKARRRFLYARRHRRMLPLDKPRALSEKVNWRIVYDRRDLLVGTCDKLAMKDYAEKAAGDMVRVPATFWHGEDIRDLAAVPLPQHWVLKPTHRSHFVYFGQGQPDVNQLAAKTAGWLDEFHWQVLGEWAYGQASRQFLVEETIGEPGNPPEDYKFFVFDGVPRLVQVDRARFTGHTRRFYTPGWEPLPHRNVETLGPVMDAPPELDRMLEAAAALGAGFDFCRIDLYAVDGEVWFGETSPYPGGGLEPFEPRDLDVQLGDWWTLPAS